MPFVWIFKRRQVTAGSKQKKFQPNPTFTFLPNSFSASNHVRSTLFSRKQFVNSHGH